MNKKRLIIVILAACAVVGAVVGGVFFFRSRSGNTNEMTLERLFESMSVKMAQNSPKGLEVSFREKYSVEAKTDADLDENDYVMSYEGQGSMRVSYTLDDGETPVFDISDLLKRGNGYLSGTQHEYYVFSANDIRVVDGQKTEDAYSIDRSVDHDFTIKADGSDCYAAAESSVYDNLDPANSKNDSFYGKIDKNILLDTFPAEDMAEATRKIFFMEAWEYVKELSDLTNSFFRNADIGSEETKALLDEEQITLKEEKDVVTVNFVLNTSKIMENRSDTDFGELPDIPGFLEIRKDTGEILHFEYDLGEYLLAVLMKMNAGRPYFKANVEEFILEGSMLSDTLEDAVFSSSFTEYSEDTKAEFVYQFMNNFIRFGEKEG